MPGLTSTVVNGFGADLAEVARLTENGASTTNARTVVENTGPDANLVSLLSGRRVFPKGGGHGVGKGKSLPSTVHASAGQYVSSIFDLAHNTSHRTTMSSPPARRPSWSAGAGTGSRGARTPTARTTAPPRSTPSR